MIGPLVILTKRLKTNSMNKEKFKIFSYKNKKLSMEWFEYLTSGSNNLFDYKIDYRINCSIQESVNGLCKVPSTIIQCAFRPTNIMIDDSDVIKNISDHIVVEYTLQELISINCIYTIFNDKIYDIIGFERKYLKGNILMLIELQTNDI